MTGPFDVDKNDDTSVGVTLKAGKAYDAPWITLRGSTVLETLRLFKGSEYVSQGAGPDLLALMKEANGASISFSEDFAGRDGTPAPKTYGKPAGANVDTSNVPATPFATNEQPMMACEHGTRKFVEWKGQKAHVCPLGKDHPDYCPPIKV